MRAKHDLAVLVHKVFDCGKRFCYSLVACDNAVLYRYVEVTSYKDSFAGNVDIYYRLLVVSHFYIPR